MRPQTRNVIVIALVIVVVVAGIGVYFALQHSTTSNCGPNQKAYICIDQAEIPDSLDPAVTFTTPGWAAVQQVYQGLVNYNGSSSTSFSGVLASGWTVTSNYNPDTGTNISTYTFELRQGVVFSNGDPYNAYVQWYSLYRSLLLEQGPQFILEENFYSTNFSASDPLSYYSPNATVQAANATLASDLNSWNFDNPTASEIAMMETANQSFQVINEYSIALNLGYGYLATNYTYLLASISAPNSYAVDPVWIDANGGVSVGNVNTYAATNTLGTGPYLLLDYNGAGGGGYVLQPNPKYWGATAAAAEPWNVNLQVANTSVEIIFQDTIDITTADLLDGHVQGASFAYIGPSTIQQLEGHSNIVVQPLSTIYGATSGSWWIYLNQSVYPFNNLSVREAIAHAINYQQIIQEAFGGYATQWVGPVPPSYPYYDPANGSTPALSPYPYDLSLAYQEMANSPCAKGACSGDTIKYMYLNSGSDWSDTASLLQNDLKAINITIQPIPVNLDGLIAEQGYSAGECASNTTLNGGPFYMGQEFYTSDYISPDDWTQNDFVSSGSANMCMAGFNNVASPDYNATLDQMVYSAASTPDNNATNNQTLTDLYATMTQALYNDYSEIWLVVPTSFAVYASNLHGFVENPMASAEPFSIGFNSQWLS
ncbi:MAG TPA: ABC transporter substrate-binding protein [Thermoplasmata archaeon]|nr:ABC transporter substrate-binding protein [Thermoplasmata archaeon]